MADTVQRRGPEPPDISEKGGIRNGEQQRADRRLFMQFVAFGGAVDVPAVVDAFGRSGVQGAIYEDVNDPQGIGVLTMSEQPADFVDRVRPLLRQDAFRPLVQKHEFTMLGRTYGLGYEPDLVDVLLHRPRRTVLNKDWPWAIWYPLRRSGRFSHLSEQEQRVILAEHGAIGMSFGVADFAHDVRLACHGLDKNDNDFIVGLIGKDLYPLSAIVQAMRDTQQTSLYLERLGPFFVGRAVYQSTI